MIGQLIALLLTFAVLSYVWRDNPLYRMTESIFVGVALGLFAAFEVRQVLLPRFWDRLAAGPATGAAWVATLLVILVVALMLARLVPPLAWLGRVPIAVAVGSLAGMAAAGFVRAVLVPQVGASAASLVITDSLAHERGVCLLESQPANALTNVACSFGPYLNQLFIFAGVVAGLVYFVFSRGENKGLRAVSRFGGWIVMMTLGVTLGFMAMAHFAVTIGRAQTMMETPGLALLALAIVVLTLLCLRRDPPKAV
ncbi:MAG: hypothetical protein ACAI38_16305 [Myxococcota bacterium]